MLRVCSLRGIKSISSLWRRQIDEPRQVALFSVQGAHQATTESATPSAFRHLILIDARYENGCTNTLQSALLRSPRNLGTCNSICQPGGAQ